MTNQELWLLVRRITDDLQTASDHAETQRKKDERAGRAAPFAKPDENILMSGIFLNSVLDGTSAAAFAVDKPATSISLEATFALCGATLLATLATLCLRENAPHDDMTLKSIRTAMTAVVLATEKRMHAEGRALEELLGNTGFEREEEEEEEQEHEQDLEDALDRMLEELYED